MIKRLPAIFFLAALAGCAATQPSPEAVPELEIGMTETEARQIMGPHAIDTGTVHWGGSGARRIYFQISPTEQLWIEIGSSRRHGRITWVGRIEPKREWTSHGGDSITVENRNEQANHIQEAEQ